MRGASNDQSDSAVDPRSFRIWHVALSLTVSMIIPSAYADVIGLTQLRAFDPSLTGTGVFVAQPEAAADASSPPRFEVNPSVVNQPASLFTYISANGTVDGIPPTNTAGSESGHANGVASQFYGMNGSGVALGVAHVDNYNANYFINSIFILISPTGLSPGAVCTLAILSITSIPFSISPNTV